MENSLPNFFLKVSVLKMKGYPDDIGSHSCDKNDLEHKKDKNK